MTTDNNALPISSPRPMREGMMDKHSDKNMSVINEVYKYRHATVTSQKDETTKCH